MTWAEILEEKNARIEKLEADLTASNKLIEWVLETLKSPIELTKDNKLPAVRAVRERLGEYLEKKT